MSPEMRAKEMVQSLKIEKAKELIKQAKLKQAQDPKARRDQIENAFREDTESSGPFSAFGQSFAHGVGNIGAGIGQLFGGDFSDYNDYRKKELESLKKNNPLSAGAGDILGETFATALPVGKAIGSLGKGVSAFQRIKQGSKIGGVGGLTHGALEYAEPGDDYFSTLLNHGSNAAVEGVIGSALGGALPAAYLGGKAAIGASKKAYDVAKHIPNAFPKSKVADEVLNMKEAVLKASEKGYNNIGDNALLAGIEKIKVPNIDAVEDLSMIPRTYRRSLNKFISNPTYENAQKAQSELGKYFHTVNSSSKKQRPSPAEWDAAHAAKEAQKRIRGAIFEEFNRKKRPDLAREYQRLTKDYEENVSPYFTKALQEYENGDIGKNTLVSKLRKNEKFMMKKGNDHPTIQANYAGTIAGTGLAGYLGLKYKNDILSALLGEGSK